MCKKCRLERVKEEYYKNVGEEDFEQTEELLSHLDDTIQNIDIRLKTSINEIHCDSAHISNISIIDSNFINHDQNKKNFI